MTMAMRSASGAAVRRPGPAPVDLVHLARQTFGSTELEREVLQLFVRQGAPSVKEIAAASPVARGAVVHRLKGSARGVGAQEVARLCEALEAPALAESEARRLIGELAEAVVAVERFVTDVY